MYSGAMVPTPFGLGPVSNTEPFVNVVNENQTNYQEYVSLS